MPTPPDSKPTKSQPAAPAATLVVSAVFFLSGASALILEIAWTRQLDLLLGNSVYAATTMIAVYMLGLGIGSRVGGGLARRATAPLKTYFLLEVALIAWALAVPLLFKALYTLFPLLAAVPGLHSPGGTPPALRLIAAVAIYAVPTLLMGATLPVLTHAVASRTRGFATRFSFLYGFNTLGAVAGTLTAGFVLLPRFGITRTVLLALSLNAVAGGVALLLSKRRAFNPEPNAASESPPESRAAPADDAPPAVSGETDTEPQSGGAPSAGLLTALAAAAGFIALALEIFWFRTLILVFGSTTFSLSAMLGIFLAGTAAGPLLLGWIGDRPAVTRRIPAIIGICFFVAGMIVIFSLNRIGTLPEYFLDRLAESGFSWEELIRSKFILSIQIIFLPALVLGAILPLCAKAIRERGADTSEIDDTSDAAPVPASAAAVARVYLANTFGATAGAVLGGLVFLPVAGLYAGIFFAGLACVAVALVAVMFSKNTPRLRALLPVLTLFLGLIWMVFAEPWDRKKFAFGAYFHPTAHSATGRVRFDEVLATSFLRVYEEGIAATVAVVESHDGALRYTSNGKVEADTKTLGMINQRLIGHLPMLLHPGEPKKIASLGLGAGVTTGALGVHPEIEELHIVDIEPAAILIADAFRKYNSEILTHPSLEIFYNDARNFLLTTQHRYDVIASDPFEPVVAGAIHLFTKEHFELAKSRLADNGVVCQWLPMYELSLDDYSSIVGTFVSVFPQSLFFSTGADSILIGFKDRVQFDPAEFARRWEDPKVKESLRQIGFTKPEQLWAMLIADFAVNPPARPARLHTDDHPFVEFSAPRSALEVTHLENRQHQLELFDAGRENAVKSPFLNAFDETQRAEIDKQRSGLRAMLEAGYAYGAGDLEPALASARKALELAPAHPLVRDEAAAILHTCGNVALRNGDQAGAMALLIEAYRNQPSEFKYLYRLALAHLRRGESAAAAPLLAAGMQRFPESPFFFSLQGSLSLESGNLQQALAFHKAAIEKAPTLDHLWEQYERAAQIGGDTQILERIRKQRRAHTE